MNELPPAIAIQIQKLAAEGDDLAARSENEAAIEKYNVAWQLVPDPKNEWEASTWLLAAIGDSCFLSKFFTSGAEALRYATVCPGGFGNPFIHMRLGQCELELANHGAATEHLLRAYALEGKDIFSNEQPKYFAFLRSQAEPPVSGVW